MRVLLILPLFPVICITGNSVYTYTERLDQIIMGIILIIDMRQTV